MSEEEEYEVQDEAEAREEAVVQSVQDESYKDAGPQRIEDRVAPEDDTPLSAEPRDPESYRKDETSSLAHDRYDEEGNRL